MACCHYFAPVEGGDSAFSVDISALVFGPGVLAEIGDHAASLGLKRVALFTGVSMAIVDRCDSLG